MKGILGADIFINLLLVFIITTGLLLMNSDQPQSTSSEIAHEKDFPETQLPSFDRGSKRAGQGNRTVTLSAVKEDQAVVYYLDDKPIGLSALTEAIKSKNVNTLRIRCDERIPYGTYINLLDRSTAAGVSSIVNVYQTQ